MSLWRRINILDKLKNIINPAQEDGNLAGVKTNTDKLDVNLSTIAKDATLASKASEATLVTRASEATLASKASEATVSSINTKVGEVQDIPTQYTMLDRLKQIWVVLTTGVTIIPPTVNPEERIRLYDRRTITSPGDYPVTLVSDTVPTGKYWEVGNWHINTSGGKALILLYVNGIERDGIRFSNAAATNRTTADYGSSPIRALAGQTVQLIANSGNVGKEWITGLNATEKDA